MRVGYEERELSYESHPYSRSWRIQATTFSVNHRTKSRVGSPLTNADCFDHRAARSPASWCTPARNARCQDTDVILNVFSATYLSTLKMVIKITPGFHI